MQHESLEAAEEEKEGDLTVVREEDSVLVSMIDQSVREEEATGEEKAEGKDKGEGEAEGEEETAESEETVSLGEKEVEQLLPAEDKEKASAEAKELEKQEGLIRNVEISLGEKEFLLKTITESHKKV